MIATVGLNRHHPVDTGFESSVFANSAASTPLTRGGWILKSTWQPNFCLPLGYTPNSNITNSYMM